MDKDIHNELQAILSKFKLQDIKQHAMTDFPEGSWAGICYLVERSRQELSSKTAASAIVYFTKRINLDYEDLEDRIKTLKLRAIGLSTVKTWFAYEMIDKIPDHEVVPFQQIASCIGRSLNTKVLAVNAAHNYGSMLFSIMQGRRSTVVCLTENCLFVTPRTQNIQLLLETIAKVVGWKSIKDCKLSGRHIPSLLKMLYKKRGGTLHLDGIVSEPEYKPKVRRTEYGLDFTTEEPMRNYLHKRMGDEENAPCIQQLTLRTKAKYQEDRLIYSTAVLSSSNVENSLRDMAVNNTITHNSLFFSMITDYCKTDMKVNVKLE